MAAKKKKMCHLLSYFVIFVYLHRIQAMNIDCGGMAFHCVNSTHFMICVDFGGGISKTVDEFIIQCPSTAVCRSSNRFECEYQLPTTTESTTLLGEETNEFVIYDSITTISPFRARNVTILLGKYLNTVYVSTQTDPDANKKQNPGSAVEIRDSSTNTMNILSTTETNSKTSFQKNSDTDQVLQDKQLFQVDTTLPYYEKSIYVKSKGLGRKTSDLINGSTPSHVGDINADVKTLNETDIYVKSLDAKSYKNTESNDLYSSTLSPQELLYSNNINIVNTPTLILPDDLTLLKSTESLKKVNIFEKSTITSTKTLSNDFITAEKLLSSEIAAIETPLLEDIYSTMATISHLEDSFSSTEHSTRQGELLSETQTEEMVTERTLVLSTTLKNDTILTYNGNMSKETSSTVSPVTNNTASISEVDLITSHSMTTPKTEVKSTVNVKGTIKATEKINDLESTTAAPQLIITDYVMKGDKTERRKEKIHNTEHFSRNQIPAEIVLSEDISLKITDNNTRVELTEETTRSPPNYLINTKDKNYNSLKNIVEINSSVHELASGKNRNTISIDLDRFDRSTIFPGNNNSEIELINLGQGTNIASTSVNGNTNTSGRDQAAIAMTWIEILNVSSAEKSFILAKSNFSTLEPNSDIANKEANSVTSFKVKEEIPPFSNYVNDNLYSEKKGVHLTTDESNMKENLTRGSDNESFITVSGQITTVPTINEISISKETTETAPDNTMTYSNITVMSLQDVIPVEMTTTEINKFSTTKSASKRFPPEPIIKTINSIVDHTNHVENEKLQSIERSKKINEFIAITDHSVTEKPVKNDFYILRTTLPSSSVLADKKFAPDVFTRMTRTTETSKAKENVFLVSEKLDILSNLATETNVPNVLKTIENTADVNTYTNSPVTPPMPKKSNMLPNKQILSNINDKILWNNFAIKYTTSEDQTSMHIKAYNQESSLHENSAKVPKNDEKLLNLEVTNNKANGYSFFFKYRSPSPIANEGIQEMLTTDVSIKVDDNNILGSDIFSNNRQSNNNNTKNVVIINNAIEKPTIISYPQQPQEVKDSIKNIIPNNFHTSSTIRTAHTYSVLPNVGSDEPKNKSIQKDIGHQEKLSYGLTETSTPYTVGQTNNLLNNMSRTEIFTKSIKTNGVVSTYPPKISVKENIQTHTDINKILYLSSNSSKHITFEKDVNYKEKYINNTQIDYLLTAVDQNVSKVSAKDDSLKTNVSSITTEKNNMLPIYLNITPISSTYKVLSTPMPNLHVRVSNKFSVTDIPTNSSFTESYKFLLQKVKNNSTVKDLDGRKIDVKYENLNNIAPVSNETTVLSNSNTSTFSTGIIEKIFKKEAINTDTVLDTSYVNKVNMEVLTQNLQENIQITANYTDVATSSIQSINKDTDSINIAKRSDGLIGRSRIPGLTVHGITKTDINKNNESNYIYNHSTLTTNNQKPQLHINDVRSNYIMSESSNNENKIRTIQKSVKEEPSYIPHSALIENFKFLSPVSTKTLDEKAFSGNNTNGYLPKQITAAQSLYTAMAELTNNPLNLKEAGKNFTNNIQFSCRNKFRGRYGNKSDCRKFYICIGKIQSLLGECPVNTVFSEIKKQCTKNLSHCFINNQFHCIQAGRFSDVLKKNVYYICVKNKSTYIRYQFQCQNGYHLNKNSVRCVNDRQSRSQISSTSLDDDSNRASDQSTVERKSKEIKRTDFITAKNDCKYEGKFWDPDDCRRYYVCSKNSKTIFRRRTKKCNSDEVFHREKKKCVNEDSYECK